MISNGSSLPKWVIAISLVVLVAIVLAFIAVVTLRGQEAVLNAPSVLTFLGLVGLIINTLILGLQAGHNAEGIHTIQGQVSDVQEKINGHLEAHVNEAVAAVRGETLPMIPGPEVQSPPDA